ncbi:tRNA (guanine-N(7)-)-methyltransferase non-catalytic subunit wdr4 [Agrilus planipennis]|uniref:tRNA (Guanine-N(7)-)-methyltransferase non-catalytic subunit wdr4 n=1 Tax=Agrilus planipennis TaxID=224129 RepID=A0A1W4XEP2_AGRPL|nr:tRNA (guanine-N(7)-)-methyltransferase non-catalytic subunit wdr4 [Agrilus planipennis]
MILIHHENTIAIGIKNNLYLFNIELQQLQTTKIPDPVLPPNINKTRKEILVKEQRDIISVAFSKDGELIAVCTSNKQLLLYDKKLSVLRNCVTDRLVSKVCFSHINEVIVADRSGDVNLYKFNEKNDEPELILGHLSILLDVAISDCGKYIVTCDRDEKIRVSYYPNSYNILSYCLGHVEFVKNIKIVGTIVISASGDGTIRFWDIITGNELHCIDTMEFADEVESKAALEKMYADVDSEHLEIYTLPITQMEVMSNGNVVYVAINLLHCNSIQVHFAEINSDKSISSKFLSNIDLKETILAFSLQRNFYILTESSFYFCTVSPTGLDVNICKLLDVLFEEIKKTEDFCVKCNDNVIYSLYKRKYNNVEEYLERKKQRLESKK